MAYTLNQLAEQVGGRVVGDGDCVIECAMSIDEADAGAISFVSSAKFAGFLESTRASAVIINEDLLEQARVPALVVSNPRATHARVLALLYPQPEPEAGVHPTAVIHPLASVAASASIGAHVVIEADAVVGEHSFLGPGCVLGRGSTLGQYVQLNANVSVYHGCHIGDYTIIHAGSVIGADGFGFEKDGEQWLKIPQVGGVVIGRHVEIGACSTVDRGALKDTVIEDGVKLDNHIQIAHNVHVGENTVMSNGVGVAGSTRIGKNCLIGGMTGIKDNIEITDNVIITAMSLVSKPLTKAGSYSSNTPIDDTRTWRKNTARFRQLDELARRLQQLEKKIKD